MLKTENILKLYRFVDIFYLAKAIRKLIIKQNQNKHINKNKTKLEKKMYKKYDRYKEI